MIQRKLKAGALQLTTMIAVVIALLLVAFILLVHTHKRFALQTDFIQETIKTADVGMHYGLKNNLTLNDTIAVVLEDESYKSLNVHTEFWGIFKRITAVSKIKTHTYKKTALIGTIQETNNRTTLYLQDNNKPLVLVGNTNVQGIAYLPKQGVKPGAIAGQSYYGRQLIKGQQRVSTRLPKLQQEVITYIQNIDKLGTQLGSSQYLNIEPGNSYENSFFNPLYYNISNTDVRLNNVKLTGHIIIQSQSKIIVEASSKLKDMILIAPEIEIMRGVRGNFQAFATKNIIVHNDVMLDYPSALVVNFKTIQNTTTQPQNNMFYGVDLHENAEIRGGIVFLGEVQANKYKPQINLEKNTRVYGEVYCQQNTELKGVVYGTVYTDNFIANQFGSVYQNHLYNTEINVDELPLEYSGLPFKTSKQDIVKWLY